MSTNKKKKEPKIKQAQKFGGHTDEQVRESISLNKGFTSEVAKQLGVTVSAVSHWKKRYKWVQEAFDSVQVELGDYAENQLFVLMKDKNPAAIIFYLKTRCKDRGYVEKQEIDLNQDGNDLVIKVVYAEEVEKDQNGSS